MIRKLSLLVAVLISFMTGFSQQRNSSSLLWEIRGNGLAQPSYLFGTFHLICREQFSITDSLKSKLAATKQFYGELAMDDPMSMSMQLGMKMLMTDRTLQSMLPASDYQALQQKFQQITGMSLTMFNNFKPFMALSTLTLSTLNCTDKVQPETEFTELAKQYRLPVLGLETIDDEINAINSQPLDSQVTDLKRTIANFDSVKLVMEDLVRVYTKRDVDSLYRFMKSTGTDSYFEQELLIKRNHKWIPVIEKAMADKPSFFAVGAGHLGGPEGVISLLRKRGYELRPVMY